MGVLGTLLAVFVEVPDINLSRSGLTGGRCGAVLGLVAVGCRSSAARSAVTEQLCERRSGRPETYRGPTGEDGPPPATSWATSRRLASQIADLFAVLRADVR